MKKTRALLVMLSTICCIFIAAGTARADDADATVSQVTGELAQAGIITPQEAAAIKAPLKNMVKKGARKDELKTAVTGLTQKGVKGDDLKQSVNSMNDLVNAGETPREAGNVVSRAAAQARAQGLKGKDLAAKVHEAVKDRKAQRTEARKNSEQAQKKVQEKEKERERAQEKVKEKEKEKEKAKERAREIESQQKGKGKGR